jgi:hypothetical protein
LVPPLYHECASVAKFWGATAGSVLAWKSLAVTTWVLGNCLDCLPHSHFIDLGSLLIQPPSRPFLLKHKHLRSNIREKARMPPDFQLLVQDHAPLSNWTIIGTVVTWFPIAYRAYNHHLFLLTSLKISIIQVWIRVMHGLVLVGFRDWFKLPKGVSESGNKESEWRLQFGPDVAEVMFGFVRRSTGLIQRRVWFGLGLAWSDQWEIFKTNFHVSWITSFPCWIWTFLEWKGSLAYRIYAFWQNKV